MSEGPLQCRAATGAGPSALGWKEVFQKEHRLGGGRSSLFLGDVEGETGWIVGKRGPLRTARPHITPQAALGRRKHLGEPPQPIRMDTEQAVRVEVGLK